MACTICEDPGKKSALLYEDQQFVVFVPKEAASKGHVRVTVKEHNDAFEKVSEQDVQSLFWVGNLVASAMFDSLGAIGTNIIASDKDHVFLDVLARFENDGVELKWDPQKVDASDLDSLASRIAEKVGSKGSEPEKQEVKEIDIQKEEVVKEEEGRENYFLKMLEKLP